MTLYSGEVLRVDSSGNLSISYLTIEDTDANLASNDGFATYSVDGVTLGASPFVDFGDVSGTLLDGSVFNAVMAHFNANGFDYYLLNSDTAPQAFATVTGATSAGEVGGFNYLNKNVTLDDEPLFAGKALVVTFDNADDPLSLIVDDVMVSDDDSRIQFNGQNGAPLSEAGTAAQVVLGSSRLVQQFNVTNAGAGDTQMVLVEVTYQSASGQDTFEALRFTIDTFDGSIVYYMPRTGSVDLATVEAYLSETLLPGSANQLKYADFGLNGSRRLMEGNGQDNFLQGTFFHDEILGKGGDDDILGGIGGDLLDGGAGNDLLYGGAQIDILRGGSGNDRIYVGIGDDRGFGDGGNDKLYGNFGDDVLSGGAGNDALSGGEDDDTLSGNGGNDDLGGGGGNDVLNSGAGRDTLRGGGGEDVFVFGTDGVTDRIEDFQNGQDLIDLDVNFASLTITTDAPGTVRILHSGEVLLVSDTAGNLTAANFTAADFV